MRYSIEVRTLYSKESMSTMNIYRISTGRHMLFMLATLFILQAATMATLLINLMKFLDGIYSKCTMLLYTEITHKSKHSYLERRAVRISISLDGFPSSGASGR